MSAETSSSEASSQSTRKVIKGLTNTIVFFRSACRQLKLVYSDKPTTLGGDQLADFISVILFCCVVRSQIIQFFQLILNCEGDVQ